jgi:hypothetical protein
MIVQWWILIYGIGYVSFGDRGTLVCRPICKQPRVCSSGVALHELESSKMATGVCSRQDSDESEAVLFLRRADS